MTTALVFAIGAFFLMALWRKLHQYQAELRFKHEVYAIRDELRRLAIQGKVDGNDWLFNYYDLTFSCAIKNSYYYTAFYLVVLFLKHRKDDEIVIAKEVIDKATKANVLYDKLLKRFIKSLSIYIKSQHKVTTVFIHELLLLGFAGKIKLFLLSLIKTVFVLPETSAAGQTSHISSNSQHPLAIC